MAAVPLGEVVTRMNKTGIEWTDLTWNPVSGCSKVSPGCKNCYAEKIAHRFAGSKAFPEGFKVTTHEERLEKPWRRRRPARVFVNSMSDLFHPDVPFHFIGRVFGNMHSARQHTFQILTKRPARMLEFIEWYREEWLGGARGFADAWPREYQHVWLGVSVEDQQRADERIPLLLQTPAAVRFVSLEPLLGPVDLSRLVYDSTCVIDGLRGECGWPTPHEPCNRLDWIIVGAETGPGARPCEHKWAEHILVQAWSDKVPIFIKDNLKWPSRIQEWPEVSAR
jgi:protein gp37